METEQEKIKLYVDTCVWVAYANATLFEGENYPKAQDSVDFIELLNSHKPEIFFSFFNNIELTQVIRDSLINLRLLGEGYSVFNLSREIKSKKMTKEEDEQLTDILEKITSLKFMNIATEYETIDEEGMEDLHILTSSFSIEMPDAFHILFAIQNDCSLFATSDKPLITNFREARKEFKRFEKLKIVNPNEIITDPRLIGV